MLRLTTLGLCLLGSLASPQVVEHHVAPVESANSMWLLGEKLEDEVPLQFTVALKQRNVDQLEQVLLSASDPKSSTYGKYLSLDQVRDMVAPPPRSINTVMQWLSSHGARSISTVHTQDFITFEVPHSRARAMFECTFCWYRHPSAERKLARACDRNYTVPDEIHPLVDFVGGILHLPAVRPHYVKQTTTKNPQEANEPKVLRKLYSIPEGTYSKSPNNSQAVTGFLDQWIGLSDLDTFFQTYSPDLKGQVPKVVGKNGANPGVEANLDIQYVMAMGAKVPTTFWSNDVKNPVNNQEPWVKFLTSVSNTTEVPWVISMSYGEGEHTLTQEYMKRGIAETIKIGVRGVSLLSSSGDDGAGCFENRFEANWISSSPYVTSIGGTSGAPKEKAAALSSGGFSNFWPVQKYQMAAVEEYKKQNGLPEQTFWNATGRGYPDVSAVALDVMICFEGSCGTPVAGTSCASPTFAGVLGLLNDVRLSAGKSSLGFLNPMLYHLAQQSDYPFNDVTEGSGGGGCGSHGFPAKKGWDAVTGLGSPNYAKLAKAIIEY